MLPGPGPLGLSSALLSGRLAEIYIFQFTLKQDVVTLLHILIEFTPAVAQSKVDTLPKRVPPPMPIHDPGRQREFADPRVVVSK